MKAKRVSYKAQRRLFAKTASVQYARSINSRPRPQRSGFRI